MVKKNNKDKDKLMTQLWFDQIRAAQGMQQSPYDDPRHYYDNEALYKSGYKASDVGPSRHLPSFYKKKSHPNRFVDGADTRNSPPFLRSLMAWMQMRP